jgi:hypothetical protein
MQSTLRKQCPNHFFNRNGPDMAGISRGEAGGGGSERGRRACAALAFLAPREFLCVVRLLDVLVKTRRRARLPRDGGGPEWWGSAGETMADADDGKRAHASYHVY